MQCNLIEDLKTNSKIYNLLHLSSSLGAAVPPDYVLSVHSSKPLVVEPVNGPNYMLADAVIQLAVAKGNRHEVSGHSFFL